MSRTKSKRILIAQIGFGRLVDELGDDCLAFAELAPSAVVGDGDELVERLIEQPRKILGARRPPRGLPDWPFMKRVCRGGLP